MDMWCLCRCLGPLCPASICSSEGLRSPAGQLWELPGPGKYLRYTRASPSATECLWSDTWALPGKVKDHLKMFLKCEHLILSWNISIILINCPRFPLRNYWKSSGRVWIPGEEILVSPKLAFSLLCLFYCAFNLTSLSHLFPMPWLNWSFLQSSLHQTVCRKQLSIVFHFSSCSYSLITQIVHLASSFRSLVVSLDNSWVVLLSLLSCLAVKNLSSKVIPCGKWTSLEAAWT